MELLTAARMRAIEQAAIDSGAVTGLQLMERAGRGVVEAVFAHWPELAQSDHRAVVLCGPGNNGGDGFVVARLLKEWGWEVEVYLHGDPARLPPDARSNHARWREIGGVVKAVSERPSMPADLMVDALFGTGLARPVEDPVLWEWLWLIDDALDAALLGNRTKTVAVDIPSGLCADSGRVLGGTPAHGCRAPRVMLTVSFHAPKLGHYLAEGPAHCGRLMVADIGITPWADAAEGAAIRLIGEGDLAGELAKCPDAHKYSHGHALILAGGPGHGGAARLAARAALRIGAGLVTLGCPPEAHGENAAQLNAIMLRQIGDAVALGEVLKDRRFNALCLGPGLGVREETRALVRMALASGRPVVLDADALTAFAGDLAADPAELFTLVRTNGAVVMPPHSGEFARLFPDIAERLAAPALKGPAFSRLDAARQAAARAGAVVLLKGHDTVIAAPGGECAVNSAAYQRAAPWLATAGAGDVLAGFVTGLLARGFAPARAAGAAAWLHVECARRFGPGLIAEDLAEELPRVLRHLESREP